MNFHSIKFSIFHLNPCKFFIIHNILWQGVALISYCMKNSLFNLFETESNWFPFIFFLSPSTAPLHLTVLSTSSSTVYSIIKTELTIHSIAASQISYFTSALKDWLLSSFVGSSQDSLTLCLCTYLNIPTIPKTGYFLIY